MSKEKDLSPVFLRLKTILTPYVQDLVLVRDECDELYLNTSFIMKNKKPLYFASVKIGKNYVSFHLMPIYVFPNLLTEVSADLTRRMQGKSCFNFTKIDEDVFKQLATLTKSGYLQYKNSGYV